MHFQNREHAGRLLASALQTDQHGSNTIVLALPRGGVPVAKAVADHLHLPLNILVVRKIGHPLMPEYAIGAVAEDGHTLLQIDEIRSLSAQWVQTAIAKEHREALRRRNAYLPHFPELKNRKVILVDDGLATGLTMRLAVAEVRHLGATHVTVAVPIAPHEIQEDIKRIADVYVCLSEPLLFSGVGAAYDDFHQLSDDDVRASLIEEVR